MLIPALPRHRATNVRDKDLSIRSAWCSMQIKLGVLHVHEVPIPAEKGRRVVHWDIVSMVSFSPVSLIVSSTSRARLKVQIRHLHTPATGRRCSRHPEFERSLQNLLLGLIKDEDEVTTSNPSNVPGRVAAIHTKYPTRRRCRRCDSLQ